MRDTPILVLLAGGFKEEPPSRGDDYGSSQYWSSWTPNAYMAGAYGPIVEVADRAHPSGTWNSAGKLYQRLVATNQKGTSSRGVLAAEASGNDFDDPLYPSKHGLQPGDLIFFTDKSGKCSHVVVYVGTIDGQDVVNQHSGAGEAKHDPWAPKDTEGTDTARLVHVNYPGETPMKPTKK